MPKLSPASSMFRLNNKIVVLTGGAGFLGQQYTTALVAAGATVIIWDKKPLEKKTEKNSVVMQVDISNESQVVSAMKTVVTKYKKVDILINNAALNPAVGSPAAKEQFSPYEDYPTELWEQEVQVNLTGTFLCTKALAPSMMKRKQGVIVNIASELSEIAYDHRVYEAEKFKSIAYIATKTGVVGLTRAWAQRLGPYNIRVNAFSPGGMQTSQHPRRFVERYAALNMLGRMAQEGEYNGVLLFLCSDASSFMTGHNLIVDGGKTAW